MCPSACWDVGVHLSAGFDLLKGPYLLLKTEYARKCVDPQEPKDTAVKSVFTPLITPNEKRNCVGGKGLPSVTVETESYPAIIKISAKEGPKTRCDPKAGETITALANGDLEKGLDSTRKLADISEPEAPAPRIDGGSIDSARQKLYDAALKEEASDALSGTAETRAAVAKKYGATDTSNDIANKNFLECIANGCDDATAKERGSKLGITLNKATLEDRARTLREQMAPGTPAQSPDERPGFNKSDTTLGANEKSPPLPGGVYATKMKRFEDEYGLTERGLSGYLAGNTNLESLGNPGVCANDSKRRTPYASSACGLNQYTLSTWAADCKLVGEWACDPSERFNPDTSLRVTAAAARRDYDEHKLLMQQANTDPRAGLFLVHNLGASGGPRFMRGKLTYGPNAPVRTVLHPIEIQNNKGLYGDGNVTFAEAEQRILSRLTGSSNFAGGTSRQYQGSPFASNPRYAGYLYAPPVPYGVSASPFAHTNPMYGSGFVPTGTSVPTSGSGVPQTPAQPTTQTTASLTAEPSPVSQGANITVKWQTTGMSACDVQLTMGGKTATFVRATSGTKLVVASVKGDADFTLRCTSVSGQSVTRTASVLVQ
jgi:hypothetical protein